MQNEKKYYLETIDSISHLGVFILLAFWGICNN